MFHIVLIHPGSTDYDAQDRIQGTLDIPLNERGHAEVAQLVEQLRQKEIEVLYTPTSQPAEQTAKALAKSLGIKLRKLDRMQNLNQGLWQGMLVKDVRRKQPKVYRQWQEQPESVCPPQGEMLGDADERVHAVMTRLLKRHREGVIALVVPEPLLSLVRRFITHGELGDLWKATNGHPRWEVVEVEPESAGAPSA
jgi:phosphoserine phosphatase